jgi:AraC-like DNA-binding protein
MGGPTRTEARPLPLSAIQRNPRANKCIYYDPAKVAAFAEQVRSGVIFPPIRVWWDGITYRLSDGLHRLAAAEQAGITEINSEVYLGTERKAQWDCYAHLAAHALRGSLEERGSLASLVFQHPDASTLTDDRIARHLGVTESLVRQWRRSFASQSEDALLELSVHVSPRWRRFRVSFRVAPKVLVATVRVERARELLRCTDLAPKDIAFRVGYKTTGELARAFTLVYGLRLREYSWLHAARSPRESNCT